MINLSLKNVYNYDMKKFEHIMKNNQNKFSLFKRKETDISEISRMSSIKDNIL